MQSHQLVGFVLIGAGLLDAVLIPILRARVPDEGRRTVVTVAIASGAVVMILLGTLFLTGFLGAAGA